MGKSTDAALDWALYTEDRSQKSKKQKSENSQSRRFKNKENNHGKGNYQLHSLHPGNARHRWFRSLRKLSAQTAIDHQPPLDQHQRRRNHVKSHHQLHSLCSRHSRHCRLLYLSKLSAQVMRLNNPGFLLKPGLCHQSPHHLVILSSCHLVIPSSPEVYHARNQPTPLSQPSSTRRP